MVLRKINIDGFVKSLKSSFDVIPAKAGIQYFQIVLDACLRRHDGVSDFLRVCQYWNRYLSNQANFIEDDQLVIKILKPTAGGLKPA